MNVEYDASHPGVRISGLEGMPEVTVHQLDLHELIGKLLTIRNGDSEWDYLRAILAQNERLAGRLEEIQAMAG